MTNDSALASNAEYIEQSYLAWKRDPESVSRELALFFEGFDFAQSAEGGFGANSKQSAVDSLVYHYRDIGHRIAQINPLGITQPLTRNWNFPRSI